MRTASAYKALTTEDKQFLSEIAKDVAMLVAAPEKMDFFRKRLTEFADKWNAYKEYEDRFLDLFKKTKDKRN